MTTDITPSDIHRHITRVLMNADKAYDPSEGVNGQQMDDLMTGLIEWPKLSDLMFNSNDPALVCIRALILNLAAEEWTDGQVLRCCWLVMSAFGHVAEYPDNDWDEL